MDDAAIVLLAGGEATRFPDKLQRTIGGRPLLLHVYERLRGPWPIYVAAKGSFAPDVDAQLDCTILIDRWPRRGPLAALLSACGAIEARYVYAVAADMPNVDRGLLEELARDVHDGDEAIVPEHGGRIEPLAALYERKALLRESAEIATREGGALHALIARLRARFVPFSDAPFLNVNTPADFERTS